jgi:rRNA biogenesis protein RRP5
MAFHLSLADIESARNVAGRAFDRIEFRQEGEKLNVWTALLTLELKYGTDRSLHEAIDRACQQNNPKHVYLRVCELLEKEVDAAAASGGGANDLEAAASRADDMFTKMCKKFKSKKSVWLTHFKYLLKGSRHEEAHALLKRSLQSLPTYKHVEVMSKFAQMEFELGSPERGRTIFDALLQKHPKRMDLLFVNIDKEVKNGNIVKARALFDSVVNPTQSGDSKAKFKFSDKQMKSLFKKWYRMEDDHGDKESLERVKDEAKAFVAKVNP